MNDSTGNNGKDPWQRKPEEGPPDLIDLFKKFFKSKTKSGSTSVGGGGPQLEHAGRYIGLALIVIVAIWFISGLFIVNPAEQAVVLRFGKYVSTLNPGMHWIPRFIDSKTVLNVQQVRNFSYNAEMLTSQENIVSVSLAVQYRIAKPENYLYNIVDPEKTIQQATSSALRQVVGRSTLDEVLTTGRQQIRQQVEEQLKIILASYQAGLEVVDVNLQPAKPPEAVTPAFNDAIKAREDKHTYINKATAYERKVLSLAAGQVARLKQSAKAYKQQVVLQAKGDTARYLALLKPYKEAPVVTGERLYLDTVSNVLQHTSNILVDGSGGNLLYLPLSQLLKQQTGDTSLTPSQVLQSDNTTPTDTSTDKSSTNSMGQISRPSYSTYSGGAQ